MANTTLTRQKMTFARGEAFSVTWTVDVAQYPNASSFTATLQFFESGAAAATVEVTGSVTVSAAAFTQTISAVNSALLTADEYEFHLWDETNNRKLAEGKALLEVGLF